MVSSKLWPAAGIALGLALAACSSASKSPTVATLGAGPTTTASEPGASPAGTTVLGGFLAYSQCMRTHGVPNFPDPIPTPSGGYGFHLPGVNPQSAAFRSASAACNALAPDGWGTNPGQQLSPAQQQQWLNWAKCVRAHGAPDFADPTFSGGDVHIAGGGPGLSPQVQSAMDACKSQMPSSGGLGG
jgi:hypothetical protein